MSLSQTSWKIEAPSHFQVAKVQLREATDPPFLIPLFSGEPSKTMLRLGDNKIFPENTRHIFDIDIETDLFHLHEKSLIIVGMFSWHPFGVDGELVGS